MRNTWLRVTVKASANTGLSAPDVFYFGNLVGETGDSAVGGRLTVNAIDLLRTRRAMSSGAAADGRYDFNRDGRVTAQDYAIVRAAHRRTLALLTAPAAAPPAPVPPLATVRPELSSDDEDGTALLA